MDLIADTTYLVGLWRGQAWATDHAAANPLKSLGLAWVVLGEFWHGAILAKHDPREVADFLSLGVQVTDAGVVVPAYGKICAELSASSEYRAIAQNDLWIAATAVAMDKPLLTRNRRHFGMVKNLRLQVLDV